MFSAQLLFYNDTMTTFFFQDIAFYHTTDKQGAFSIRLDPRAPDTKSQLVRTYLNF
jgi:hypothetical protein